MELRTPVCKIPHTRFAMIADGTMPVIVYIAFPRMIHRDEHRGMKEVVMPEVLQALFWDEVVLPVLNELVEDAERPYVDYTTAEFKAKAAKRSQRKGNAYRPKTYPIDRHTLQALQKGMRSKVDSTPGHLDRFGSHFFIVEAMGIKHATRVSLPDNDEAPTVTPWQKLGEAYPALDLDYMLDRNQGELLVDIGVSINPTRTCATPMVALWRLDALEASYGAGGYLQGTLHTADTFMRYGGLQAEMAQERARRTHVQFRSTYNLHYEAMRPPDNNPFFAADGDAYMLTSKYRDDCERRIKMFGGKIQYRSFGARDEYRVGGQAMMEIFRNIGTRVRTRLI